MANYNTAEIAVGGNDIVDYKYELDSSGTWSGETAVSTPILLSDLANAVHTVSVIGKNTAGDWQAVGAATTASWIVYDTGPVATLSGQPTGVVNYTTVDIAIDGGDISAYKYKLDSGTWSASTPVTTDIELSGLADGHHTISVIGKDTSDTWQAEASATAATWTVYTMGPIATLSGQPSGTVNYATAAIAVAGGDIVAYKYKLDSGTWSAETPVSTNIVLSGLAAAEHTVYVVGKKATGTWQTEAAPTTATWTVAITGPSATLSGQPTGVTGSTAADITVGGPGIVSYRYKVDSGSWSDMITPGTHVILSGLSDGLHTVYVMGRDATGNWQTNDLEMRPIAANVATTLEHLKTAQGYVWAFKVSLIDQTTNEGAYLWYATDAPYYLLKYDDGNKVMSLVEHS
ncbi:MAG: hypothetical protein NTU41_13745 [Chloroflexi bacterium]|nr:hypothetical protein [Chloroflexota bacterium]